MIPSMDLKATSMLFLVVKVDIVTIFKKNETPETWIINEEWTASQSHAKQLTK